MPHRKRVQHFHTPGDVHELTFSCYQRLPLLDDDGRRVLFSRGIDAACERHSFRLVAFVFMPEHAHLLVFPTTPEPALDAFLSHIKRPVSFRIKQRFEQTGSEWLERLTIPERPGKTVFRFWQEGGGYDRNLNEPRSILGSIDYFHLNPVRRGLVEKAIDWKWSSARWYQSDRRVIDDDLPTIHGLPAGYLDCV